MCLQRRGFGDEALGMFGAAHAKAEAVTAADEVAAASNGAQTIFHRTRLWIADTRLGLLRFDGARKAFHIYYGDDPQQAWRLGFSLLETWLRARDFEGAERHLQALLAEQEFADWPQIHEQLGYLAGLRGDRALATKFLEAALARERNLGVYVRIWMVLIGDVAAQETARKELAQIVESPSRGISDWDVKLVRFVIGQEGQEGFLQQAQAERQRRLEQAELLDNLMAEVWFYVGARLEREGRPAEALAAWRETLKAEPAGFKWEWEYARLGLARLAERRELPIAGGPLASIPAKDWVVFHRFGSEPRSEGKLWPGDLVLWMEMGPEPGRLRVRTFVAGALEAKVSGGR
ncbi:MAG: hypothetical protein R3F17_08885 [Planctomycetota bacterium]